MEGHGMSQGREVVGVEGHGAHETEPSVSMSWRAASRQLKAFLGGGRTRSGITGSVPTEPANREANMRVAASVP